MDFIRKEEQVTLRRYDIEGADAAVRALSLGQCRKYYLQIMNNNISSELDALAGENAPAMVEALKQRIKLLERQGRAKSTFNVSHEFEVAEVTVNFAGVNKKGTSTHISGARDVDVACSAGVASHKSKKIGGVALEQAKIARKVAALVKQKPGQKPAPQLTIMPKMLGTIDYSGKAVAMALAVQGGTVQGLVTRIMDDFNMAKDASQMLYSRPPREVAQFIGDHKGFKYVSKKVNVGIKAFPTEQANKKAIKNMLNVYPGQKSGPGNLAASHTDGIPVTGKMRQMLDHAQDFKYREADVYYLAGSKSQVYTSIFKNIQRKRDEDGNEDPFLVMYSATNSLSQKVLTNFIAIDENGSVAKIKKTGIICGEWIPRCAKTLRTYYVDFTEPVKATKDKISLEADTARTILLDKIATLKGYTYYQVYANYLSLSFPIDAKKDESYSIKEPASWDPKETYYPSLLGRKGIMIMCGDDNGVDSVKMAEIMLNMIYHSILFVYVGQHMRTFSSFTFPDNIIVDFSLESTIRTVSSAITGGLSVLGEMLGDEFKRCIEDKQAEVALKRDVVARDALRKSRDEDERKVNEIKQMHTSIASNGITKVPDSNVLPKVESEPKALDYTILDERKKIIRETEEEEIELEIVAPGQIEYPPKTTISKTQEECEMLFGDDMYG